MPYLREKPRIYGIFNCQTLSNPVTVTYHFSTIKIAPRLVRPRGVIRKKEDIMKESDVFKDEFPVIIGHGACHRSLAGGLPCLDGCFGLRTELGIERDLVAVGLENSLDQ